MPTKLSPRLLSWAPDIDDKTQAQAERSARLPFIAGHVALMPDAHYGYGATVGSVIPTEGAIIPSAVGVDIGCGMIASLTSLMAADLPDSLDGLHGMIARVVPAGVGAGHLIPRAPLQQVHQKSSEDTGLWTDRLLLKADQQLGSLGSGNHFVEICLDEIDRVVEVARW